MGQPGCKDVSPGGEVFHLLKSPTVTAWGRVESRLDSGVSVTMCRGVSWCSISGDKDCMGSWCGHRQGSLGKGCLGRAVGFFEPHRAVFLGLGGRRRRVLWTKLCPQNSCWSPITQCDRTEFVGRTFKEVIKVIKGGALIQYDWCPLQEEKETPRMGAQRKGQVRIQ